MDSFGNQYPEEGTLAWELGVLRFPFPRHQYQNMTYYLLWASHV